MTGKKRSRNRQRPPRPLVSISGRGEPPDEAPKCSDDQLCKPCRALYEQGIANCSPSDLTGGRTIYVGPVGHIAPNESLSPPKTCRLCQFLYSMRVASVARNEYHLYAFIPDYLRIGGKGELADQHVTALAVVSGRAKKLRASELLRRSASTGLILCKRLGASRESGPGYSISPLIDWTWARSWVETRPFFGKHERRDVNDKSTIEITHLPVSLIDCRDRTIKAGSLSDRFVALSYVWGTSIDQSEPQGASLGLEAPHMLPETCPAVIEDAIEATQRLGFKYLWVDRFCVDQVNEVIKHDQILQMDKVYGAADLTIISPGGDSNVGLSGVSHARVTQGLRIVSVGEHTLEVMASVEMELKKSPWGSRGWTYQERFFSRHCLIFSEDQLYLECRGRYFASYFSESMPGAGIPYETRRPSDAGVDVDKYLRYVKEEDESLTVYRADGKTMVNRDVHKRKRPGLRSFEHHIYQFAQRQLTFRTDALKGVAGILTAFSENEDGQKSLFGIPVGASYNFIYMPPHRIRFTDEGLAYGLCWTHGAVGNPGNIQRVPEFPSWTWAGWTGLPPTWLPHSSVRENLIGDSYIEFTREVQEADGHFEFESAMALHKNPHNGPAAHALRITAVSIPLRFGRCPVGSDTGVRVAGAAAGPRGPPWKYFVKWGTHGDCENGSSLATVSDCPLHLTRATGPTGEDFEDRLLAETWTGLVLKRSRDTRVGYALVVGKVSPGDDHMERIGIVVLPEHYCLRHTTRTTVIVQ